MSEQDKINIGQGVEGSTVIAGDGNKVDSKVEIPHHYRLSKSQRLLRFLLNQRGVGY